MLQNLVSRQDGGCRVGRRVVTNKIYSVIFLFLGKQMIYTHWRSYYPSNNNGEMSCVAISNETGDLWWVNRNCEQANYYLCKQGERH